MKRCLAYGILLVAVGVWSIDVLVSATSAQMYFARDKNGVNRVSSINEGDQIFIVVVDSDENTDCDVRDKIWTDVKIMDPKTGAYIVWASISGDLSTDYLEETAADTGVFVSKRAFRVGTREAFTGDATRQTHVVDVPDTKGHTSDFRWGHYVYGDNDDFSNRGENPYSDNRVWIRTGPKVSNSLMGPDTVTAALPPSELLHDALEDQYLIGRFENMDTLIGVYRDPDDAGDIAVALLKIVDTEAVISWNREIYADANEAATVTVVDPDENLDCSEVEAVPVFIIVNPGSWSASSPFSKLGNDLPTTFCALKRTGGVDGTKVKDGAQVADAPIHWYNIYNAEANFKHPKDSTGLGDGRYYIQYDTTLFDTSRPDGLVAVSFYAWETGPDTGVFQLNLNSLLADLDFNHLNPRDVLVAYYLDPNDFDDFKLATAAIEEWQHSVTSFVNASGADQTVYWIGRDPIYVEVIDANANVEPCCPEQVLVHLCDPHEEDDAEWWVLDEAGSNASVFLARSGMDLRPAWDAMGIGLTDSVGGFQLLLDNWRLEVFNEDDVYVRYNDVVYTDDRGVASFPVSVSSWEAERRADLAPQSDRQDLPGLGDSNLLTDFPPRIDHPRVANDLSFDFLSVADTQVFDGAATTMWFLDRQGDRVAEYTASDCVFIEVVDPDQDEDQRRRERIDAYWDGGQSWPFGPHALNPFGCTADRTQTHSVNALLGDMNLFGDQPDPLDYAAPEEGAPKIYVLNPRSGRWAAVDLLETGPGTGRFVSTGCINLAAVYSCTSSLAALPGDTIVAVYQDPSNHSDSAWISIKVGIGGGGSPASQASSTRFVDGGGQAVSGYAVGDAVWVKVIDPSHAGTPLLAAAVTIDDRSYDLMLHYDAETFAPEGTFMTDAIALDLEPGDTLTAVYVDPTDPGDSSSATASILAGGLTIERFYTAPNPVSDTCVFAYVGTGTANEFTVSVYRLDGHLVWSSSQKNVRDISWDARDAEGQPVANGAYLYAVRATAGTAAFTDRGTVFVLREP